MATNSPFIDPTTGMPVVNPLAGLAVNQNPNMAAPRIAQAPQMTGGMPTSPTQQYGAQDMNLPKAQPTNTGGDFRNQLAQELAKSQQSVAQQKKSIGIGGVGLANFQERGTKIGKRLVATKEGEELARVRTDAIKELQRAAGFQDEATKQVYANTLTDKFNQLERQLKTQAAAYDAKLRQAGIDEERRRQAAQMWGSLAFTLGGALIGGMAGGPAGAMGGAAAGGKAGELIGPGLMA
jgi:hypothetical protein